jgi:hypothetical protein
MLAEQFSEPGANGSFDAFVDTHDPRTDAPRLREIRTVVQLLPTRLIPIGPVSTAYQPTTPSSLRFLI